ncbi:MAG: hypothetical protein KDJ65_21780 [Anaerolineae bacterium]|nr:hypothetical protein [Anaerolineae bacterium]
MTDVFIISEYLMFGHGLKSLLASEEELRVVGQEKEIDRAIELISEIQPDVVVVFGNGSDKINVSIVDILNIDPNMQIIGVSVQDNTCYTYSAKRWNAMDVSDLVNVIKSDHQKKRDYSVVGE